MSLNSGKSPTYRREYGGAVNERIHKSPYTQKSEDSINSKSLPLRPVNVFDITPHPTKDVGLLYEFYFPESAAEHRTPSVAEMSFIQQKIDEKDEEREKEKERTKRTRKSENEKTDGGDEEKKSEVEKNKEDDSDNYNEGHTDIENQNHLPPLTDYRKSLSLPKSSTQSPQKSGDLSGSQRSSSLSPSPFRSLSSTKESRLRKKEWKQMSPHQKKAYADYIDKNGKDWRDIPRDDVWKRALERIDKRVENSQEPHLEEVATNAKEIEEERRNRMIDFLEKKDARQKIAQDNRLTPTQIRKLAVIATKEWKKYDYARKKQEKEERAAEIRRKKIEEENAEQGD